MAKDKEQNHRDPLLRRAALGLVRRTASPEWGDSVVGDLEEEWQDRSSLALFAQAAVLAVRFLLGRAGHWLTRDRTKLFSGADLRFAVRGFLRNPRHSILVILVLTLGIGANTAIFSVVYAVLLKPLPYPEPERLVTFYDKVPQFRRYILNSPGSYLRWRESQDVFSEMAAFRNFSAVFTEQGPPVSLRGATATASIFALLDPPLLIGRGFSQEEDQPGGTEVVLIREGLWRSRFGGDPALLGRPIRIDGVAHSVIGVFPDAFLFPPPLNLRGRMVRSDADFLVPLRAAAEDVGRRGLFIMARLRDGISLQQADQRLQVTARELARGNAPDEDLEGYGAAIFSLHPQAVRDSRTLLMVLSSAVLLVLLIACLNVANLQLARAADRGQELAIRAAMGAGPGSLLRQVLTEGLLMALAAGLCGAFAAAVSLQSLIRLGAGRIPLLGFVSIDPLVMAFTLVVSLLCGLLFGLLPAIQASGTDVRALLSSGGRGGVGRPGARRLRNALVIGEIALAVMLLVGAGLLIRSLYELQKVDVGFQIAGINWFAVELPPSRYPQPQDSIAFQRRLEESMGAIPGVSECAFSLHLPLGSGRSRTTYRLVGEEQTQRREADFRAVSPAFFEMLEIPVLEGRGFRSTDNTESPGVTVINRALRDQHWPGRSPVGEMLVLSGGEEFEIVGVAENTRQLGLGEEIPVALYLPMSQTGFDSFVVLLRSEAATETLAGPVRARVEGIDPELPVNLYNLEAVAYGAASGQRSPTVLLAIFAGLAVLLALIGLYGVISYLVRQRTGEIGVRMAMGAVRSDILRLIGTQVVVLVAVGLSVGFLGALGLGRMLSGLLYGITPGDPPTYAGVLISFTVVAVAAGLIPARRAARLDPLQALRRE